MRIPVSEVENVNFLSGEKRFLFATSGVLIQHLKIS